jgi:hypothetical protein
MKTAELRKRKAEAKKEDTLNALRVFNVSS